MSISSPSRFLNARGAGFFLLILALAGCQAVPLPFLQPQPTPATPTSALPMASATPIQWVEAPSLETPSPQVPGVLRIWLPPQFDPAAQTRAAELLRIRLELFASLHPETRLEVRLKAESGPGGLLAALSAASVSAPLALPDVVALPHPVLEAAALKGVIYPLDGFAPPLDPADWYPYAYQLGYVQDRLYGLPFATDLLVMAYNPAELPSPPADWPALAVSGQALAFAAADPQALFTLFHYRSLGGMLLDAARRPTLDVEPLVQVLTAYQQANAGEVLPFWVSQFENDAQVWQALYSGEAHMGAVWASRFLNQAPQSAIPLAAAQLPALGGQPYSLATGWAWALASPDPERQALASELIQFLSESDFLAVWDAASGYLPPMLSAMQSWQPNLPVISTPTPHPYTPTPTPAAAETAAPTPPPPPSFLEMVSGLSVVAELLPPDDILAVLGPALRQASLDVLKQQASPEDAAGAAIAALGSPP